MNKEQKTFDSFNGIMLIIVTIYLIVLIAITSGLGNPWGEDEITNSCLNKEAGIQQIIPSPPGIDADVLFVCKDGSVERY